MSDPTDTEVEEALEKLTMLIRENNLYCTASQEHLRELLQSRMKEANSV